MIVLHIDDDDDILQITKIALEMSGTFQVISCRSGADALALIEVSKPDAVLLDVMMPGMNGPNTLREIRALPDFQSTPVIFFTASVMEEQLKYLWAMGAVGVISKPFDPLTLAEQLTVAIRQLRN